MTARLENLTDPADGPRCHTGSGAPDFVIEDVRWQPRRYEQPQII